MITRTVISPDRSTKQSFENVTDVDTSSVKGSIVWIDCDVIDESLLEWLSSKFHLDQYSAEDIRKGGQRVKVEDYREYTFCTVKSPLASSETPPASVFSEIFALFSDTWIVTIHRGPSDTIKSVMDAVANRGLSPLSPTPASDLVYYMIIDFATDAFIDSLTAVEDDIYALSDEAEKFINFRKRGLEDVKELMLSLSRIRARLIALRTVLSQERDALGQIMRGSIPYVRNETLRNFRDVHDHSFQLVELVDSYVARVNDVRDLYFSLRSALTDNIIKVLTIVATIFLPLALLAGIYGMNFTHGYNVPGSSSPYGFYIMIIIMTAVGLILVGAFRRYGWI
ncbi:MAG: magnesium transporter CorA family protein [Thermoplasmata archaeon]|nr:magnesium transporter CorA family protein [Candidatus Sysuiplasma acidicola]MBX8638608.1 magnesium transporter CorA family protein [Candidatus Sysuiplasma acidicola]MBX8646148.1 magnesium transporter CorA family protein [Candidatus Sysuiplasma acidicola]